MTSVVIKFAMAIRRSSLSLVFLSLTITLVLAFLSVDQAIAILKTNTIASPVIWIVINNADSGDGSLRQALLQARTGDSIQFDPDVFSPNAAVAISLVSRLPTITQDELTIDASNAGVILDGHAIVSKLIPGLKVQSNGVAIHGLQIINFTGCGIEIRGADNTIGGDKQTGSGPLGQANLLSGNHQSGICLFDGASANTISENLIGTDLSGLHSWGEQGDGVHINGAHHNQINWNLISGNGGSGVQICCSPESTYNTIENNLIGVGIDGHTPVPNLVKGVLVSDGANHNTIGPGNVIANTSSGGGISISGKLSPANTILGNSIYNNLESGISLWNENTQLVTVPAIVVFDLLAGNVSGVACPDCLIQIYSDNDNEGQVFEGQTIADHHGQFSFSKGKSLTGPYLTTTATESSGTTSMFSVPTSGVRSTSLQAGNKSIIYPIVVEEANQLIDNRLGFYVQDQTWVDGGIADADVLKHLGVKRARGQMNDPDAYSINWDSDELLIRSNFDQMITGLELNGIETTYILIYWDKENYRQTGEFNLPRFQTEAEIQRYLDFVRLMVQTFGDRVDYWELWNEPGYEPECNQPFPGVIQCIPVETYIELGKRTIQTIQQEDPGAKIVIPSYHAWDPPELYQNYFYRILQSDLMPLIDVISWHPFITALDTTECGGTFIDTYWITVLPEIKSIAVKHGFQGEFRADELRFATRTPNSPTTCTVNDRTAGKYYLREIVRHLGQDVSTGIVMNGDSQVQVIERLATLMAGSIPTKVQFQIQDSVTNVLSTTFRLPSGDLLIALWQDIDIQDIDPAITVTLSIPGSGDSTALGIDVLAGFQQYLNTNSLSGTLVIKYLHLKDYPFLLRLSPRRELFLPLLSH